MVNGSIITNSGKNILLRRAYTANGDLSSTEYLAPVKFSVSVSTPDSTITDTSLTTIIPISNGVVNDDGTNTFTGVWGGDNTTDNTTTYKEGAGVSDNTSQNLNTNNTNRAKVWEISSLSVNVDATYYAGFWLYIKDAVTLAKFNTTTSIYSIEIKLGSDNANYYYKYIETSTLTVGWNWISLGIVNILTSSGTPSASLSYFYLQITLNDASDVFVEGDCIYDLLRSWQSSDQIKTFAAGYPVWNVTDKTVSINCYLTINEANGYLVNGCGLFNEDTISLISDKAKFTSESKTSGDEIIVSFVNRVI